MFETKIKPVMTIFCVEQYHPSAFRAGGNNRHANLANEETLNEVRGL